LAEERSKEDLLELMGRMEGFDVHANTRMQVEYDKLFERRYPYVEKISRGFHHSVSDLLKVYPDSPPREQVLPHKPSSEKAPATSAPPGLSRGSIAQTDILKRFENLQTDFKKLTESHAECGDLSGKLIQARLDLTHNTHLYTSLSDWHKALKNEHEGCAGKLEGLENRNRELSQAIIDQVLQIKELEAALAQKDSALVYAERINAEQAQEKEKLVSQVGKVEMEKFDCIRKLLPTVVERILQSYEYKHSLSEPFNLAIQAGWGKGLAEERSKEDLLELMGRMEGFDVHANTRMQVEYDKLFERRYPYVEKISRGFHHSVSDLLKVYPDSPPREQVLPHKPSSEKAPATSAPPGS
nr:hypothetical protein [Tanacetum cinerariifolium]